MSNKDIFCFLKEGVGDFKIKDSNFLSFFDEHEDVLTVEEREVILGLILVKRPKLFGEMIARY